MAKTREMVIPELAGLWVRLVDGTVIHFTSGDEDTGGVREPRRPRPKKPITGAHATIDS